MVKFILTTFNLVAGIIMITSILSTATVADADAGKKVFIRCVACHSLTQNRVGPSLGNIFDKKIGSAEEFKYSEAMKTSDIIWDNDTLDSFLKAPTEYIEGTKMVFVGIKKDSNREALITYLKENQVT